MIKKICGIFKMVIMICFYWLIKCPLAKEKNRMSAKYLGSRSTLDFLENSLVKKIKIYGELLKNEPDKVNILFANHNSTADVIIICGMIYKFNIENFYFIFKKSLVKVPILGDIIKDDISLNRNWDSDKDNIKNQVKGIKKGYIIIYPEGTRFSCKKHKDSIKFSIDNKLPIYNYTLTPRVKGSHLIFKTLFETNKLGKIFDMTIIFSDYINKELYLKNIIYTKDLGELYVFFKEINYNYYDIDYEIFKKKMFDLWLQKNIIIDLVKRNKIK